MSQVNPFGPAMTALGRDGEIPSQSNVSPFWQQTKRIFIRWELLRIPFNLVLAIECVAIAMIFGTDKLLSLSFWLACVFGAIVTNVAFFLAPMVESYVDWLGFRSLVTRLVLFAAGLMLSAATAAFALQTLLSS